MKLRRTSLLWCEDAECIREPAVRGLRHGLSEVFCYDFIQKSHCSLQFYKIMGFQIIGQTLVMNE